MIQGSLLSLALAVGFKPMHAIMLWKSFWLGMWCSLNHVDLCASEMFALRRQSPSPTLSVPQPPLSCFIPLCETLSKRKNNNQGLGLSFSNKALGQGGERPISSSSIRTVAGLMEKLQNCQDFLILFLLLSFVGMPWCCSTSTCDFLLSISMCNMQCYFPQSWYNYQVSFVICWRIANISSILVAAWSSWGQATH